MPDELKSIIFSYELINIRRKSDSLMMIDSDEKLEIDFNHYNIKLLRKFKENYVTQNINNHFEITNSIHLIIIHIFVCCIAQL